MMRIQIVCVGKLREKYFSEAAAEYAKRLLPFCKLEITELPETRLPASPEPALIRAALEKEGSLILDKISRCDLKIPLCVEGKQMNSERFAQTLARAALEGKGAAAFIIGGSHGLSDTVKRAGDFRLSFSEMTFPHHLMRVMLLEQLYRAFQILGGGKYHK